MTPEEEKEATKHYEKMIRTVTRRGKPVLRYKPGTKLRNSDGEVYIVQEDGSWRLSGHK